MKIKEIYQVVNELHKLVDTDYYVKNLIIAWEDRNGSVHTRFAGGNKKEVFKFMLEAIKVALKFLEDK